VTKKYLMSIIITAVISVSIVGYMYFENYISFESGIQIIIPAKPDKKYVEKSLQPANVESLQTNTELVSKPQPMVPSKINIDEVEPRLFDDIITAVKTFGPILTPIIPLYLNRKNKQKTTKEATT